MNRDPAHQASQRLADDWAAPEFARSFLTKEALQELLPRFDKLEPLVRVRLLLAAMHLPLEARAGMVPQLEVRRTLWHAPLLAAAPGTRLLSEDPQTMSTSQGTSRQSISCLSFTDKINITRFAAQHAHLDQVHHHVRALCRRCRRPRLQTRRSGWA